MFEGKKTYLAAAAIAGLAIAEALGYPIPVWVWPLLNAAGLGALRQAVGK